MQQFVVRAVLITAVVGAIQFIGSSEAEARGGWRSGGYSVKANRAYLGGGKYYVNGRVLKGSGVRHAFGPPYRIGGVPVFSGR